MRFEGGNDYQYVYNSSSGTVLTGFGVALRTAATGYSVIVTTVTGVTPAFGVIVNTFPTANYGWVLKRGFAKYQNGTSADSNDTGVAVGDPICMGGVTGAWVRATSVTGYLGTIQGFAIDATGTAGSGMAYFNCV
jgi:hypothetical protein